jgi:hypothetical protein
MEKLNQDNYELMDKVLYKGHTALIVSKFIYDESTEEVRYEVKVTARNEHRGYWTTGVDNLKVRS